MSLFISRTFRHHRWGDDRPSLPPGKVPVGDALAARELFDKLRVDRADTEGGQSTFSAGEIAALALLDDAYQGILDHHLGQRDTTLMDRVLAVLRAQMGSELLDRLLVEFAEEFLGVRMAGLSLSLEDPLGDSGEALDRPQILRQVVVFWLIHSNPAAQPVVRRLHSSPLLEVPAFHTVVHLIAGMLDREPGSEEEGASLWRSLIRPYELSPDSLSEQLSHLRRIWSPYLSELSTRMNAFLGMLAEEQRPRFPDGPGPSEVPTYQDVEDEVRFSTDRGWMSRLVLVAKHTLVWLHQLSGFYDRSIERLDQIPDAELERLASLGFNGLWLIGLWQRSPASERIKKLCGNPQAAASAYSLTRYRVAAELGGEAALGDLRRRAGRCGIRLAADMVPNHTGLDSDWLAQRPDWFISQERSPFPAYSFQGENLSSRPEMEIYLEDHYFDRTDAAVVFKRVDRPSGQVRYVYHGNDGTSMPWNDTAQLDYLNPEIWPVVIDAIVDVARRFPVIRFDAAMTLTRRHFQRLWYPTPETAGDIPSRAEHGLSRESFLQAMPQEFWRLVVDRVAQEAPDTLLLAEAFWLMEGFFVRTLGMHRVYNSAFMNMLRDGETEKFRQLIKETLVFDPEILKRYVNFMSNPDESSAIEQFGDGDRYFGTCVVMSTLPGLPMFGHGQVEGWRERYGMEYRRAYVEETPREDLLQRHYRQIAPLLGDRNLYAEVGEFRLFDVVADSGQIQEHALAYCNQREGRAALVLFNNSDQLIRGTLRSSAPFRRSGEAPEAALTTVGISQALGVAGAGFWTAEDRFSGLHYLLSADRMAEQGLRIELSPWESRVLTGLREVQIEADLATGMIERMGSRGVANLTVVQRDLEIEPFRQAFEQSLDEELFARLMKLPGELSQIGEADTLLDEMRASVGELAQALEIEQTEPNQRLLAVMTLPELARSLEASRTAAHRRAGEGLATTLDRRPEVLPAMHGWVLLTTLQDAIGELDPPEEAADWRLHSNLVPTLIAAGGEPETVQRLAAVLAQALRLGWGRSAIPAPDPLELQKQLLADEHLRQALGVNQFEGQEYISQEALAAMIDLRLLLEAQAWSAAGTPATRTPTAVAAWWESLERLSRDADASAYRTDGLGIAESTVIPAVAED